MSWIQGQDTMISETLFVKHTFSNGIGHFADPSSPSIGSPILRVAMFAQLAKDSPVPISFCYLNTNSSNLGFMGIQG